MSKVQTELEFDPEALEVEPLIEDIDLGEHEFEVDMLEAQAEEESEEETDEEETDEEEADDASSEEESSDEESEEDSGDDEDEEDSEDEEAEGDEGNEEEKPDVSDSLANPDENPLIPRERLNQSNRKRQEESDRADTALARVAELESQIAAEAANVGVEGIDPQVIKEAAEKVLDGDTEAFSNVIAEQMNKMRESMTASQEAMADNAVQQAMANIREEGKQAERDTAADHWTAIYPELDHNSADTLNKDALQEAIDIGNTLEAKGYAPKVAMERAVKAAAAMYDLKSTEKPAKVEVKEPAPKVVKKKAVKRVIKQPAATGTGDSSEATSPKVDMDSMTQDEWDALPESTRESILTG